MKNGTKKERMASLILSILLCVVAPVLVHTNSTATADLVTITQNTQTWQLIDAEDNEDLSLKH